MNITSRIIRNVLSSNSHIQNTKLINKPLLTLRSRLIRRNWASQCEHLTALHWHTVIFSDEKKFSLDGPDGNQAYSRDKRDDRRFKTRRHSGGGKIMVWAAFNVNGKTDLCFISETLNVQDYVSILENNLVRFVSEHGLQRWIFQHDGARVHAEKVTKRFLNIKQVDILDWPAYSPDMNRIENLWVILSNRVYTNGVQFGSISD